MGSTRHTARRQAIGMALFMLSTFAITSAYAADGCKFLLCIAGPWASISQCVPTVREVLRDLARGRAFPNCSMAGAGNSANNAWVDHTACPSMYRHYDSDSGMYMGCSYQGRISVYVNDGVWSQVFWNMGGDTTTWYSDTARASLTQQPGSLPLDDRFGGDLEGWNSAQVAQCRSNGGTSTFDQFGAFLVCNYPNSGDGNQGGSGG